MPRICVLFAFLALAVPFGPPVDSGWPSVVLELERITLCTWSSLIPLELELDPGPSTPEPVVVAVDERPPVAPRVRPAMGLYRSTGAAPRPA